MWWFLTQYGGPYEVNIHEKSMNIHNFKKELVNVKMSVKMV